MLRTLLRRSQRRRERSVLRHRRSNIANTRQDYLDELAKIARVQNVAAARIQAMKRRWDAKVRVAWMRKIEAAALLLQKHWRGILGRRIAHEEKMKLIRVVPTKFQMQQLKKRCIVMSRFGEWQELRDSHTNHIFFYHTPTGDSQWDPPTGKELGDVTDYHCTFEDCLQIFPNLLALEHHRDTSHRWQCPACFQNNSVNAFPKCQSCGNEKGGSGRNLTVEYEEKWETKLIVTETKKSQLSKSKKMIARNTLTELRPQSAVDRSFFKVRKSVLLEIKQHLPEDRDDICDREEGKEWPNRFAQRGPVSQHTYERKMRKRRDKKRRKEIVGDEIVKRLTNLKPLNAGDSAVIPLKKSNIDKEIREWTKGRPITPLLTCKLMDKSLHDWFESNMTNIDEEDSQVAQESKGGYTTVSTEREMERPLGENNTEDVSLLTNHGESKFSGLDAGQEQSKMKASHKPGTADCNGSAGAKMLNDASAPSSESIARPRTVPLHAMRSYGMKSYKPLIRKGHGGRNFESGAKYTGDLLEGTMNGRGTMVYQNGDTYVGAWKNGVREGDGTFRSRDGRVYEGTWKSGSRDGHGELTHPNGEIYIGQWKDGKMSGCGTLSSTNGDTYEGRWLNSKYHGLGKFTKANGQMFVGICISGKANGKGIIRYPNGENYKGMWKDDRRHGKGVGTFPNGSKYIGSWERGKFNGKGKLVTPDGEVYVGNWFMGKRDGYGKATFSNQDTYVGTWEQDKVGGTGVMYYHKSGNLYDGNFQNGMRNGLGTLKLKDDGSFYGYFKNGRIHGRGQFRYGNGDVYKGNFKNGL